MVGGGLGSHLQDEVAAAIRTGDAAFALHVEEDPGMPRCSAAVAIDDLGIDPSTLYRKLNRYGIEV